MSVFLLLDHILQINLYTVCVWLCFNFGVNPDQFYTLIEFQATATICTLSALIWNVLCLAKLLFEIHVLMEQLNWN